MKWILGFAVSLITFVTVKSAGAASPRLFEIYSIRFIRDTTGQTIIDRGQLTAEGEFKHYIYSQLAPGTIVPPEAFERNLLPYVTFPAYNVLGVDALANFRIDGSVHVGGADYFVMAVNDHPKLDIGAVVNLSARGHIAPGRDPLIVGFVVADHLRRVLLRAVGPTLSKFGVTAPLADPVITLYPLNVATSLGSNDDWGQEGNVGEIEAASSLVGAFPLPRRSKDAVLLIELPPGAYTAVVSSADAHPGTAITEIYLMP
jgi:hypothetical protein